MKLEPLLLFLVSRVGAVDLSVNGEMTFDLKISKVDKEAVFKGRERLWTAAPVVECQYQYPEKEQIDAILSSMMNELTKVFVRAHDFLTNDKKRHTWANEKTKSNEDGRQNITTNLTKDNEIKKILTENSDEAKHLLKADLDGKRRRMVGDSEKVKNQTKTNEADKHVRNEVGTDPIEANKEDKTLTEANIEDINLVEASEENKTKSIIEGKLQAQTKEGEKYEKDKPLIKTIKEGKMVVMPETNEESPPKVNEENRNQTKTNKHKRRPQETRFRVVNERKPQFFEYIYHNMTKEYSKFYNNTAQRVDRTGRNPCQHQKEIKQIWRSLLDNSLAIFRRAALHCVEEHLRIQKNDEKARNRLGQFLMRELSKVRNNHLYLLCDLFQLCFNELQ